MEGHEKKTNPPPLEGEPHIPAAPQDNREAGLNAKEPWALEESYVTLMIESAEYRKQLAMYEERKNTDPQTKEVPHNRIELLKKIAEVERDEAEAQIRTGNIAAEKIEDELSMLLKNGGDIRFENSPIDQTPLTNDERALYETVQKQVDREIETKATTLVELVGVTPDGMPKGTSYAIKNMREELKNLLRKKVEIKSKLHPLFPREHPEEAHTHHDQTPPVPTTPVPETPAPQEVPLVEKSHDSMRVTKEQNGDIQTTSALDTWAGEAAQRVIEKAMRESQTSPELVAHIHKLIAQQELILAFESRGLYSAMQQEIRELKSLLSEPTGLDTELEALSVIKFLRSLRKELSPRSAELMAVDKIASIYQRRLPRERKQTFNPIPRGMQPTKPRTIEPQKRGVIPEDEAGEVFGSDVYR